MEEECVGGGPGGAGEREAQKRGPEEGDQPSHREGGALPRGQWANKREFLLSMAGEIIGLGNVWRFPYLCYKNGGGVFFIPYFIFLFFCGIPVFFLETALGQYTSEGGVTAWRKICPMFEGVGVAAQVIVTYLNIYYIVVLAWALFYLFNCFTHPLPWASCDNAWNTVKCHKPQPESNWSFLYNDTYANSDYDYYNEYNSNASSLLNTKSPEEEFWMHRVLKVSDGASMLAVNRDLALCLLLAWVICYFCIWKGIRSTGKVVYFTATFPYLMLVILLVRGLTLPGAWDGIKVYLSPDLSRLADPTVWSDAGTQVFFSYAVCQGVLTALGSYNKYNNNCYKDCVALCVLNSGTSMVAGFVVFSVLGFMAQELGQPVEEVAASGVGLAFIAYPKALSLLPGAQFWSVLFFLMILTLGLDSQFVCVESLATAITDVYPGVLRRKGRREVLVLIIAISCFLLGLPLVTGGGIVLFSVMDSYGVSGTSLLFIACFETIVIGWAYGADRFYDNISDMIGYRPFPVIKYCWLFITPIICWVTLTFDLQRFSGYSGFRVYNYSPGAWAGITGALLILTPLLCIPAYILRTLCKSPDGMTRPSAELRQSAPHAPRLTLCGYVIFPGRAAPPAPHPAEPDEKTAVHDTSRV